MIFHSTPAPSSPQPDRRSDPASASPQRAAGPDPYKQLNSLQYNIAGQAALSAVDSFLSAPTVHPSVRYLFNSRVINSEALLRALEVSGYSRKIELDLTKIWTYHAVFKLGLPMDHEKFTEAAVAREFINLMASDPSTHQYLVTGNTLDPGKLSTLSSGLAAVSTHAPTWGEVREFIRLSKLGPDKAFAADTPSQDMLVEIPQLRRFLELRDRTRRELALKLTALFPVEDVYSAFAQGQDPIPQNVRKLTSQPFLTQPIMLAALERRGVTYKDEMKVGQFRSCLSAYGFSPLADQETIPLSDNKASVALLEFDPSLAEFALEGQGAERKMKENIKAALGDSPTIGALRVQLDKARVLQAKFKRS